jgi:hypothetical protein
VTIIVCTQDHVLPDECPECGGWLHTIHRGGVAGPCGRYCSEDCVDGAQHHADELNERVHLHARDLLCACPVCTAAGHPTETEVAEYRAYLAEVKGEG